jgi:TonB family protein
MRACARDAFAWAMSDQDNGGMNAIKAVAIAAAVCLLAGCAATQAAAPLSWRLDELAGSADWRDELSTWVRAHAYYPSQAAERGEQGAAMVQVIVQPDGHVTSVELKYRTGSPWLDMALVALFRDAHLPPLKGEHEPLTFDFTMHYLPMRQGQQRTPQ